MVLVYYDVTVIVFSMSLNNLPTLTSQIPQFVIQESSTVPNLP